MSKHKPFKEIYDFFIRFFAFDSMPFLTLKKSTHKIIAFVTFIKPSVL